ACATPETRVVLSSAFAANCLQQSCSGQLPTANCGVLPMPVKPIPDNSSVVMPRLFCRDPAAELEFCKHVFGAAELNRRPGPDGKVAHALITIGLTMLMIESDSPQLPSRAPQPDRSSPVL